MQHLWKMSICKLEAQQMSLVTIIPISFTFQNVLPQTVNSAEINPLGGLKRCFDIVTQDWMINFTLIMNPRGFSSEGVTIMGGWLALMHCAHLGISALKFLADNFHTFSMTEISQLKGFISCSEGSSLDKSAANSLVATPSCHSWHPNGYTDAYWVRREGSSKMSLKSCQNSVWSADPRKGWGHRTRYDSRRGVRLQCHPKTPVSPKDTTLFAWALLWLKKTKTTTTTKDKKNRGAKRGSH